jgi:hypothetical protein
MPSWYFSDKKAASKGSGVVDQGAYSRDATDQGTLTSAMPLIAAQRATSPGGQKWAKTGTNSSKLSISVSPPKSTAAALVVKGARANPFAARNLGRRRQNKGELPSGRHNPTIESG